MIDLNEILIFTKVVETKGFTAAADQLNLQKSTISRKISSMEARLGVRLINRTTRKLSLTDIGTRHYERCRRIIAEYEEAELAVTQDQNEPTGNIRLSLPIELGQVFMGKVMGEFITHYPKVSMTAELSTRAVDLIQEGIDIAFKISTVDDIEPGATELCPSRRHLYASPNYLAKHGCPLHPNELQHHRMIQVDIPNYNFSWCFSRGDESIEVPIKSQLTVNNITCGREAVISGYGISCLPTWMCRDAITNAELVPILDDWELPKSAIYAYFPSRRYVPYSVRMFVEFAVRRMHEEHPELFNN